MFSFEREHSEEKEYLYHQFDNNLQFHLHMHHSFEFIYVEEGLLNLQAGSNNYQITAGNAALILPGQLHAYSTPVHSLSYLCIFSCDYVYDFYTQTKGKTADNPVFPLDDKECIALLNTSGLNRFQIKSALYYIIGQFLTYSSIKSTSNSDLELLEQTVSYIQSHFLENITLKSLAAKLGYHYNYLSGYLNEQLGLHFSELINLYRIDYACELLKNSDASITEIAENCGFETIRSFNRNFLKVRQCTPKEYRRSL